MKRFHDWLYRRIDKRGRIPLWVRLVWRRAHWCSEMDDLLIIRLQDVLNNCHCSVREDFVGARRMDRELWGYRPERDE